MKIILDSVEIDYTDIVIGGFKDGEEFDVVVRLEDFLIYAEEQEFMVYEDDYGKRRRIREEEYFQDKLFHADLIQYLLCNWI